MWSYFYVNLFFNLCVCEKHLVFDVKMERGQRCMWRSRYNLEFSLSTVGSGDRSQVIIRLVQQECFYPEPSFCPCAEFLNLLCYIYPIPPDNLHSLSCPKSHHTHFVVFGNSHWSHESQRTRQGFRCEVVLTTLYELLLQKFKKTQLLIWAPLYKFWRIKIFKILKFLNV